MAPFLTTVAGTRIKATHLAEIDPARNRDLPLVPQVIGKSPSELRTLLLAIRALGYARCDLNAGCPWPMIVKKGRGAGLLRDADVLHRMLEVGCDVMPGGFSIKVRLGIDSPHLLFERMEVINAHPLCEVTIHARTAHQRYAGAVDLAAFARALEACRHPVLYNGDIRTAEDHTRLSAAFPSVAGWMLGRGAVADPFLAARIRAGRHDAPDAGVRAREWAALLSLLGDFRDRVLRKVEPRHAPGRIKQWLHLLARNYVQAQQLFAAIRPLRTFSEVECMLELHGVPASAARALAPARVAPLLEAA